MANFQIFKMAADRHFGLLKVLNFNSRYGSDSQCMSLYRIRCRSVKLLTI